MMNFEEFESNCFSVSLALTIKSKAKMKGEDRIVTKFLEIILQNFKFTLRSHDTLQDTTNM